MCGGKKGIGGSPVFNFIYNLKINSVTDGVLAFGNGINIAGATTADSVGGTSLIGDCNRNTSDETNNVTDSQEAPNTMTSRASERGRR